MSRRNKNRPKGAQNTQGVTDAVSVLDAFSNPLYRLGWGSQSPLEATEYPLTRMTDNYALLNSLYRDNWVVQNVVGLAVDDMLREWYEITGSITPAAAKAIAKLERKTRLRARLNEGLRWGRLYGGAAGLILIKGQEDLSKPLDLGMIYPGSFQGLYILDRWQGITPNMGLCSTAGKRCRKAIPSPTDAATRWQQCITPGWYGSLGATCPVSSARRSFIGANLRLRPCTGMWCPTTTYRPTWPP